MTDTIYRCPSCKARVELSDTICSICGETLTPVTLLRTYSAVKQLTRPVSGGAPVNRAVDKVPTVAPGIAPQTVGDVIVDVAMLRKFMSPQTAVSQKPVSHKPVSHKPAPQTPAVSGRAYTAIPEVQSALPQQPNSPSVAAARPQAGPRRPSSYTLGLMLGCAVVVLGVALFIGINLAREATPEVRAIVLETPLAATQAPAITIVFSKAGPTDSIGSTGSIEGTVIAQGTAVAESLAAIQADATTNAQVARPTSNVAAKLPRPTATVPLNVALSAGLTATTTALPQPALKWHLELASARYETSGRPTQNCGRFKADDVVRKFTFTLQVTNNTGADLDATGWGAVAYTGEKPAAQLCYFKTEGPLVPTLLHGQTRQVTLSAFIEPEQRISKIVIGDNVGNAARICLKDTQVVDCE